jgi:hypothetical protein
VPRVSVWLDPPLVLVAAGVLELELGALALDELELELLLLPHAATSSAARPLSITTASARIRRRGPGAPEREKGVRFIGLVPPLGD